MDRCFFLLLLLLMSRNGLCQQKECAKSAVNSCADCVASGPYCAWCQQLNFTKSGEQDAVRCDTEDQLKSKGCKQEEIVSPKNELQTIKEEPLSASFDKQEPVQISPQQIRLKLRPGLSNTFTVKFKRVEGYPVDLYYLMDLSYSMKDDLANVKNLGEKLFEALSNITQKGQIGFGAFVDKAVLPYTNTNKEKLLKPCDEKEQFCQAAFGYRHVLSMTSDQSSFRNEVGKQFISGNLDTPEGCLDAMMQASVCGDKIGWRNSSTRLIVLATDAGFHMAGDGKLAGILEPNDERCHMENNLYSKSSDMDYPSVGQLAMQLEKNNIQPIFAVTENMKTVYEELSNMIPKSEVGVLSSDSSNVVELIRGAYNRLSSKVTVTHDNLPDNVGVSYKPKDCSNPEAPSESKGVCNDVGVNQEISFDITVTAKTCMKEEKSFSVKLLGIKDTLTVTLSTNCECQCTEHNDKNHILCNGKGRINCGTCSCGEGSVGQFCECNVGDKDEQSIRELCRRQNGTECEGRGDCECGRCQCHTMESGSSYYGEFCQCDDEHCEKFQNKQCAGNGVCRCGKCECFKGFEGSACHCKVSEENCQSENNTLCNGRGKCKCGLCECAAGYQLPLCETCLGCPDPCLTKLKCIECLGFNSGPFQKNCSEVCSKSIYHKMVDNFFMSGKECRQKDSQGCWITFKLKQLVGQDNYEAEIQKQRECPEPPSIATIIGGSLAGVALIGIVLLMILKLLIYLKDLKEFKKFDNERKRAKWAQANNPLFQDATTTVANPMFTGE
ncbi:integrin beta-2 isoform X2 [Melanotaenia boesemani]|nr:integrin beta-2 isoform X2 [Melanotaenia boesemani]XP_041858023.1 integrin beta-2 isoform X2 [Melanotaenia boesemani]